MLAEIVMSNELKIVASLVIAAIAGVLMLVVYGRSWLAAAWAKVSGSGEGKQPMSLRSADQPAPKGTAEYLRDLEAAAPGAPADFIVKQAKDKATIAGCQRDWITALRSQLDEQRKGAT